jgi:hypothetical protein
MKKLLLLSAFFINSFTFAQNGGWRENEMEVKVFIPTKNDATLLHDLQLNGEIHLTYGLMDVIPSEFEKVKSSGLKYEIMIENLNDHYKDFWRKNNTNSRAEKYHTYEEIIALMDSLVGAFPEICKKISFGTSVQGRQLCSLKISDNVNTDETEPEVLVDGGIHGDEIGGAENAIRFARRLCASYNKDSEVTTLINSREIWIYPMINPDGRVNVTRYNANQIDLNRDCGYMWNAEGSSKATYSQIETKAIRECMYTNQFVIHLNGHSGSENVFYPWCHRPAKAPDYSNFNKLAGMYSSTSKYPSLVYTQSNADYATTGEVDDCSYGINGTMGMVLEISTNKQPSETDMIKYYNYNVPALMMLLNYAGYGVEGLVTDSVTGKPVPAVLFVDGFYPVYADPLLGDYHKYLLAGTHSIKVVANGYAPKMITQVNVTDKNSTVTNIKLQPLKGHYIYKVVSAAIPGNNPADEGNTPAVIGSPDKVSYSIGKGGTIIVDLQYPAVDNQGNDIQVVEGDASAEGFTCYAGQTMEGPWKSLGTGKGTTDFDLSQSGLASAQFIKIVDDNDGTANANDAGFELDAIQVTDASITGIEEQPALADFIAYPNPFTNTLTIQYSNETAENTLLNIYNSMGQRVLALTDKEQFIGKHVLQVDASALSPGIYYCQLQRVNGVSAVSTYIIKL